MPVRFTDQEIARMLADPKRVPGAGALKMRAKHGHREAEVSMEGPEGYRYFLLQRQSEANRLDFSVILAVQAPGSSTRFRLRRHNGKSHEHTNRIERATFYDFHIHMATERYQLYGMKEDAFAEPTARYGDLRGALGCLCADCCIEFPGGEDEAPLFAEVAP